MDHLELAFTVRFRDYGYMTHIVSDVSPVEKGKVPGPDFRDVYAFAGHVLAGGSAGDEDTEMRERKVNQAGAVEA